MPKQFLKRIERTGYGEFLFYDWFRSGEIELEAHPILVDRPQLRLGLLARARRLGPQGLRLRRRDRALVLGHLLFELHEERAASGVLDEEHCRAVAAAGEARIDLDDQTVNCAEGVFQFEIDEDIKHRLLNGLDDVAMTLQRAEAIDEFEAAGRADAGPVTTSL